MGFVVGGLGFLPRVVVGCVASALVYKGSTPLGRLKVVWQTWHHP